MNITLPTIALLASTLVACSDDSVERDFEQPSNDPVRPSAESNLGKVDRTPPAPLPMPAAQAPSAVLVATTAGDLWLLNPVTGALIDLETSTAIDLFASPQTPSQVLVTGWSEDGGGALLEYDVAATGLTLKGEEPLYFEDTRLLYGPTPTAALGVNEGTTLFVGSEGRSVFGIGSFLVQRDDPDLDFFLLEHARKDPRILHLRWDAGLREVSRTPTSTPLLSCPPRLVRDAPEPLIASIHESALYVSTPAGTARSHLENAAAPDACVEDALWLGDTDDIAVVTGPDIRIHLVSMVGAHDGESLVMPGNLWHDPRPHRRLAYDPSRSQLWIALSEQLEVRRRTPDGHLEREDTFEEGCDAESVTLVW